MITNINTKKLILKENGVLDTSAKKDMLNAHTFNHKNGKKGDHGGNININTEIIEIYGSTTKTRFLLNGGSGWSGAPGEDGAHGTTIPSIRTENINNLLHHIIYIDKYYDLGDEIIDGNGGNPRLPSSTFYSAQGSNQWPTDGEDATPGGAPGAGGDGGHLSINANSIISINGSKIDIKNLVSLNPGSMGTAHRTYIGGNPGKPQASVKHFSFYKNKTAKVSWRKETHYTKEGADAPSPQSPIEQSYSGSITYTPQKTISFTKNFYQQKLNFIRDLYINRQFDEVHVSLNSDLDELLENLHKNNEYLDITSRYALLKNRLSLQQDYFGFSLRQAPLYALDFTMNQFEAEIEMALSNYFVIEKILNLLQNKNLKQDQILEIVREHNKLIDSESEQQNSRQAKISELSTLMKTVKKNENAYLQYLKDLNSQIEEDARNNVSRRNTLTNLTKNIKTLAALAKVIPVGQPALAAAASVIDHITNIPSEANVADWISYIDNTKNGLENTFSAESLSKSQSSIKNFIDKFNSENLKDTDLKNKALYIQKIYTELKPVYNTITETTKQFSSNTVPHDDLEKEIQKIKASHPLFIQASNKLQDLVQEKSRLYSLTNQIMNELVISSSIIEAAIQISMSNQKDYLKNISFGDTTLQDYTSTLKNMAEERLLYVLHEVHKSYEYTTLQTIEPDKGLELIQNKIQDLIKNETDTAQSVEILKSFYMTFINRFVIALDNQFKKSNPIFIVKTDSVILSLPEHNLNDLNSSGLTVFDLNSSIYGSHQKNIRLSSIEIDQAFINFTEPLNNQISRTFIDITHSGAGYIEDQSGKNHFFSYPLTDTLHSWGSSYQFESNKITETKSIKDESLKGILGLLLRHKGDSTLLYSPIFAQPAGLTQLIIKKHDLGGKHPLKNLKIKVNYTFN